MAPPACGGMGGGGGKPQTRTSSPDKLGCVSHILCVGAARGQECTPALPVGAMRAGKAGEGGRAEPCGGRQGCRVSHILCVGAARGQECTPALPVGAMRAGKAGEGGRAEPCGGRQGCRVSHIHFRRARGKTPIIPHGGPNPDNQPRQPTPTRTAPARGGPPPPHPEGWGASHPRGPKARPWHYGTGGAVGFLIMIRKTEHHHSRISGVTSKRPSPVSFAACCNQSSTSIPYTRPK